MHTHELIESLATKLQPTPARRAGPRLAIAFVAGMAAMFVVQLSLLGARPDLTSVWTVVGAKLGALAVLGSAALMLLSGLASPGRPTRASAALLGSAAVATALLAVRAPIDAGHTIECLLKVAVLAAPIFIALVLIVRRSAPTRLRETGLVAGLAAGAVGGSAYSWGCMVDDPAAVALQYGLAVGFCGLVGWLSGRRLLRW